MSRAAALAAAFAAFAALPARPLAEVARYGVRSSQGGLVVEVPYSMGTHHERVTQVDGVLRLDPEARRLEGGRLTIPLAAFQDDNAERACHLREALGLDYERSRYPREHVCDHDRLPGSGPDAIAYPAVVLELGPGGPAGAGDEVEAQGTLTVHGVARPIRLALALSREAPAGTLRVRGRVPLRLSDFGVVVKSARALFVTISVRDEVAVQVDALLEPVPRAR